MRRTGTFVLVLIVLAFVSPAYAGNGNGNGNGNGKGSDGAAPGNSGNAPGQVKKDDTAAATPAQSAATTTTTSAPAPAPTTTAATNATGVKPANDTAHDTHAQAQSDKTKQYGNGTTAGQVAEQNGAAGTDVLHGPGNSQPHKATPCSGGRHEVDVHALKSHGSGSCGDPTPNPPPTPTPNPTPHPNPNPTPIPTPDPGPTPKPKPNPDPPVVTTTTTPVTTTATPGTTTTGRKTAAGGELGGESAGATQGVLSATQRFGHAATLPFTGQRLWVAVLLGVILIATGLALREIRTTEASVESGHDHTDRSRHAAHGPGASLGGRAGR